MDDKTLIFDLDSTLAPNDDKGELLPPYKGAKGMLDKLKKEGFSIGVHTGRTSLKNNAGNDGKKKDSLVRLRAYFKEHKLPVDFIWKPDKASGAVFVDDRGVNHNGNFYSTYSKIHNLLKDKGEPHA